MRIEAQFLWSAEVARHLARAMADAPALRLIAGVPRYPDRDGRLSGPPNRIGQQEALEVVRSAGGDRVAVYDLESVSGWPIYVHAKVCIVDDAWAAIGSDNLNRRSWTHDSELTCAVLDEATDDREPTDPGGGDDGARRFARDLRIALWREHLGGEPLVEELLDPVAGFDRWRRSAEALDGWNRGGRRGDRPPGHARAHSPAPVGPLAAWGARPAYRYAVDPDRR